jgi:hypothetical protein
MSLQNWRIPIKRERRCSALSGAALSFEGLDPEGLVVADVHEVLRTGVLDTQDLQIRQERLDPIEGDAPEEGLSRFRGITLGPVEGDQGAPGPRASGAPGAWPRCGRNGRPSRRCRRRA